MTAPTAITASAPGKAILFGEHAINRGQPALSTAVGLYARCTVRRRSDGLIHFASDACADTVSPEMIHTLGQQVADERRRADYDAIRKLARSDYFGPQKYILSVMFPDGFEAGLALEWKSEVPAHSGLGSGGSAFVAMVAAVCAMFRPTASLEERAMWAHCGDIIAHGGVASALDTQTSLLGGVIRFAGQGMASSIPVANGLRLVIADSLVSAATSEVNTAVRLWLAERPQARLAYFRTIGALSRAAEPLLARGDFDELGRLMDLNQLVLEKIGVSCPAVDRLIDAALSAGALGAKISGSGGGGIIIGLVHDESLVQVADALRAAGGRVLTPQVSVPGVRTVPTEDAA
jgi:mevalonate kinase